MLDNIPSVDTPLTARLDDYMNSRGASFVDWLPDGGMLIATRFGDVEQLHRVATPLGAREQLTFYREPVTVGPLAAIGGGPGLRFPQGPGRRRIRAGLLVRHGDARRPSCSPTARACTAGSCGATTAGALAFHGTSRDGVSYDLFIAEPAGTAPPRLIYNGFQKNWSVQDWSPDDTKLLVRNFVSANESHLFVLDIATAALTPVSEGQRARERRAARNSRPRDAACTSSPIATANSRNCGAWIWQRARWKRSPSHIPWDIEAFARSDDGRYLAWVANVDGMSRLTLVNVANRTEILPPLPDGQIARIAFDRTGKKLALSLESAQSPRDVFVLEVERNALVRYTKSEAGPIDPLQFVPPELVRYPTFDREPTASSARFPRSCSARARPVRIRSSSTYTAGRNRSTRRGSVPFTQFLVREMGFAVIAPNVRGSTGYGKTFMNLDNGEDREDSVKDIGALLVWIGLQKDLDAKKVFVAGGSYGGYMSLASMVHFGDRLRGGIDVVGISSFVTFLESTSAYRRDLRRPEYGDERLPRMRAYLQRISPLTNAARIAQAVARGAGPQRSASAGERITTDGREDPRARWRGLVPGREGRRSRVPQEIEPRLLPADHRHVPGQAARPK